MEEIVNLIGSESPASDITDKIKDVLYTKASERIDDYRTDIASSLFGNENMVEDEE
jgi:hypothetical protein